MANLERIAAMRAQAIIANTDGQKKEDVENVVTKALGVFQEQGIYAGMLYLLSRSNETERPIATAICGELVNILNDRDLNAFRLNYPGALDNKRALLDHFSQNVCSAPVQTIFLFKELFELTFTYARYTAKART